MHGQDVGGGQRGPPPALLAPHQTQVVTLQKHLEHKVQPVTAERVTSLLLEEKHSGSEGLTSASRTGP